MQKSKLGAQGRRGSKNLAKGGKVSKEKKQALKAGKRDNDSDSDFSYRSVVSAGGTRHVRRRRKHADGTYSDSASYHSSQDDEGDARRRRRRRDREHGANSANSYYSVVSEGGTRHVRRKKRHEDGTYSASESYHSSEREDPDDEDDNDDGEEGETSRLSKDSGHESDSDSSSTDYSYASETSEGGTRYETKRKRIRDAEGNVVGYGETKPVVKAVSDTESVKTRRGSVDESINNLPDLPMSNTKAHTDVGVPDDAVTGDEKWPGADADDKVPSEFSDATTDDDDVDLSKMTEEEKKEYFAEKEKKKQAREKRRREKYGSRYDEILKKKEEKRLEQLIKEQKERDEQERLEKELTDKERRKSSLRRSSLLSGKPRETPKSMVTYEKGTPREYGPKKSADKRDHGLGHESWGRKDKEGKSRRGSDSSMNEGLMPKFKRETTMLQKLPPIPQGKLYVGDDGQRGKITKPSMVDKESTMDTDEAQFEIARDEDSGDDQKGKPPPPPEPVIEVGADGRLRLKKKKIDLSELDDDTLRRLGIDPSLSAIEIAKKLKELFGDDVKLTMGGEIIGTRGVDEYDSDMNDDQLAAQEDLDLTTLKGKRRVNVLFKRGGSALKRHLQRLIDECTLLERAKRNLDERDSTIDFLAHYRLVDPTKIDGYAKAFVIEDEDFDTVINLNALQIALEGIETLSKMTPKQREYVIKVLHIDEATEVTFRMFSVITALCERVTNMDSLSQHLLEICSMADIERKMELYKAMFYHNIPSYRNNNHITSESLKIEMIAGGLNWNQQDFVMEKMEPNTYGEISFLDYMCYIPLFLSLHDNICDNPLDMSNNKYQMPPRKRPPSVQRDVNPLGNPLKKTSTYRLKARSLEVMEGKIPKEEYSKEYLDVLNKYAKLPNLFANANKRKGSASSNSESGSSSYDMIY